MNNCRLFSLLIIIGLLSLSSPVGGDANNGDLMLSFQNPEWREHSTEENITRFVFSIDIEIWNPTDINQTIQHPDTCGFHSDLISQNNNMIASAGNKFPCGDRVTTISYSPGLTKKLNYEMYVSVDGNVSDFPDGKYLVTGKYYEYWYDEKIVFYNTTIDIKDEGVQILEDPLPQNWGTINTNSNLTTFGGRTEGQIAYSTTLLVLGFIPVILKRRLTDKQKS